MRAPPRQMDFFGLASLERVCRLALAPGTRSPVQPPFPRALAGLLVSAALATHACAAGGPRPPHPELARLWRSYQALPAERALAVAGDPKRLWVAGLVGGEATPGEAKYAAMVQCRQRRAARRFQAPCRLYAVGDEIVWKE